MTVGRNARLSFFYKIQGMLYNKTVVVFIFEFGGGYDEQQENI